MMKIRMGAGVFRKGPNQGRYMGDVMETRVALTSDRYLYEDERCGRATYMDKRLGAGQAECAK